MEPPAPTPGNGTPGTPPPDAPEPSGLSRRVADRACERAGIQSAVYRGILAEEVERALVEELPAAWAKAASGEAAIGDWPTIFPDTGERGGERCA